MNKEYKIKLDLNKKLYNKKMTFNQFDENVNDFYIEVTKNNEVVKDLDKSIVTLVTIKPNNTVDAQFIEAKEGQIYADLKPSMCDVVGNYQAKAMIVLEGEIVTTDTINYSVSEDKIISRLNDDVVSDERFPLFTDALSRLSTIEISEEERIINEAERILAEENRKTEEAKRRTTENARVSAENTRVSNENARKSNEEDRKSNETSRVNAETQRQTRYNTFIVNAEANANEFKNYTNNAKADEEDRKNNELDRKSQEDRRLSNEITRISNENNRKANEVVREKNETNRQSMFTDKVNKVDNKIYEIENRFNTLTSKQQQDAEVIDARNGESSLGIRLNKLDSQLAHKATISETKNIQQQINNLVLGAVGDGNNPEIVQSRGEFDTLNERLDEMDSTNLRNVSTNLLSTHYFRGVYKNGAIYEQLDDLTYKVTCKESWGGTFNHSIKASYGRSYMIICKVKAGDENAIGKNCWPTFYQYKGESALSGLPIHDHEYYTRYVNLTSDYQLFYYGITVKDENTDRLDLGISSATNATFIMTDCIILDITPLSLDEVIGIDFPKYPYWNTCIENFVNAQHSLHSVTSEISERSVLSDRAKVSTFAENGDFVKLTKVYENLLEPMETLHKWGNGASYELIGDTLKVTPNGSWGGEFLTRYYPNGNSTTDLYNKRYKLVCAIKSVDVDTKVGLACFLYGGDFKDNLGSNAKMWSETVTSHYKIYNTNFEVHKEGTNTLAVGIKTYDNTPYPSFILKGMMLIDITDLTEEEITKLNDQVQLEEYWENYPNIADHSYKAQVANMALDLDLDVKNSIIEDSSALAIAQANIYTNKKVSEVFAIPFVNETSKLEWTTKQFVAGATMGWWVANNSKDLTPNSTYLYVVKWEGKNQASFQRCQELRNGKWYNPTTVTYQHMNNTDTKVMSWIFTTDDTVTSPNLCCVINAPTLIEDVNLTVELYKIEDENYINTDFAVKVAQVYRDGNILSDFDFSSKIKWEQEEKEEEVIVPSNKWYGKNALVIGDSITAEGRWQLKLKEELGMNVTTHAKGGIGIIAMVDGDKGLQGDYDNETNASGTIYPLNADKVKDKHLIVVLPAYNERGREYGQRGDLYPSQSTIIGMMQYQINRIYEELAKANNLDCKVLIATPHCAGAYNYNYIDGYGEYPSNSGRTMQTLSNTIKEICNYNNIPVCDLWHNSGINKFTWTIYGANPNAIDERYTKYQLNEKGEVVGTSPMRYVKGNSYYQLRDGQVVLEEYTGASPYPFVGDQLHCSSLGYARIGECIVGSIIKAYGY